MAKYTVKYLCGHEGVIELFGPTKRRDWILSQKELELCPDCYYKETKKENEDLGFASLKGSEKQCRWAETLRRDFISGKDCVDMMKADPEFEKYLKSQERAKFWIDNREISLKTIYSIFKSAQEYDESFADDLPDLKGTPKQISWALKLREKFFKENTGYLKQIARKDRKWGLLVKSFFERQDTSRFWIDTRDKSDIPDLLANYHPITRDLIALLRKNNISDKDIEKLFAFIGSL